jgi:hypothetical protein
MDLKKTVSKEVDCIKMAYDAEHHNESSGFMTRCVTTRALPLPILFLTLIYYFSFYFSSPPTLKFPFSTNN